MDPSDISPIAMARERHETPKSVRSIKRRLDEAADEEAVQRPAFLAYSAPLIRRPPFLTNTGQVRATEKSLQVLNVKLCYMQFKILSWIIDLHTHMQDDTVNTSPSTDMAYNILEMLLIAVGSGTRVVRVHHIDFETVVKFIKKHIVDDFETAVADGVPVDVLVKLEHMLSVLRQRLHIFLSTSTSELARRAHVAAAARVPQTRR